ncbi:TRAP transporter small permease subunit [Phaeobacter sp. J2-8]|uniref:TRAP transporter small permease n=1 Tax=Phaeobacter sp. J2-8 TaxID=2931394 RepID=UPI001FD08C74|nr:TRAP transporter small permease subunit [Phaeobacter sp. J2-8]MCJ7873276.1 TRAP transporter small permease subunit [Phaeobacter sp. J2-8]
MKNLPNTMPVWAGFISRFLSYIAAASIFSLMALVFLSVFFRYVLNSPIAATEDLMAIMLGITIFTAFPAVTLGRGHIKVDLLVPLFAKVSTFDRIRLIAIDVGIVAMSLFMAKRLFDQGMRYYQRDTTSLMMDWPLYPVVLTYVALLVIGAALFALRAAREAGNTAHSDHEDISL